MAGYRRPSRARYGRALSPLALASDAVRFKMGGSQQEPALRGREEATVDAIDHPETVLLVDAKGKLLPVSTSAFQISSGPKRRVEQSYNQSTVIYRNGSVKKINRIDFLGYWGATAGRRLLSAANGGVRRIALDLTDQPQITLDEVKRIVCRELPEDRKLADPYFGAADPLSDVIRRVSEATTSAELFDAIGMPLPQNALDILC